MLTEQQLAILRSEPGANRVAKALSLAGVTQMALAKALGLSQPYVSDVVRQRYRTITVEKAWKFARYFGCCIEVCSRHPISVEAAAVSAPPPAGAARRPEMLERRAGPGQSAARWSTKVCRMTSPASSETPRDRIRPLMETFGNMLMEQWVSREVFGVI